MEGIGGNKSKKTIFNQLSQNNTEELPMRQCSSLPSNNPQNGKNILLGIETFFMGIRFFRWEWIFMVGYGNL